MVFAEVWLEERYCTSATGATATRRVNEAIGIMMHICTAVVAPHGVERTRSDKNSKIK